MALIEFDNVSFSYSKYENNNEVRIPVINNLNLQIEQGSFVAVLGHNGCGKSTIAKLINGLLVPDEGRVIVNGISTDSEENIFEVRRNVGMVFQNPDNQIVSSIVEEDVAFGVENLGINPDECRIRVDNALKSVGMYDYRFKSPDKLSGGQKQRVAVAGIIAMKPKCIVLDESTAMLDPVGRKEVMDTILNLNRQENITIILITHYMEEAVKADRVVVIDDGNVAIDGNPRQVFSDVDKLKSLQLDVPQSTQLAYDLNLNSQNTVLNAQECAKLIFDNLN